MVKAQSKACLAFGGAIFLCNHLTRKECFEKKIFGLSPYCADFVERVKAGTTLFLFDIDQRKLHGVFEATSDGAVGIIPDAYISMGQSYPSQVAKLLHLFSSRNRLQPPRNPRLPDDLSREIEIPSLVKEADMQSSPNSSSSRSLRSPCQTCSSSTLGEHAALLGHKLIDPVSLVHRVLQADIFDVAKSNSSKSPLHTGADTAIVTIPSNQEAKHDQSTDDYIPLPQEEDALDGFDDLFGLLEDECRFSESKGSSDSEGHTTFHQARVQKEDGCYPPMLNSKLHSYSEGRTSVFSRLVRTHETYSPGKRSKTEAFPPRSAEFYNPLFQREKQQMTQCNKPFPCHNDGVLDMPSADKLSRVPASSRSFVWKRSTRVSGGKQSEIQTCLGPFLCEDGNKWDVSNRQSVRYDTCKKPFVSKGCPKLIDSCDKELNMPAVFAGVNDSSEVNAKKEMRTPSFNFKRRANDSHVGGDQDFYSEDVEGAGRKKRQAMATFHQEYPSGTELVPEGTKTKEMLAISDENSKEKSISLSSKDTCTQLSRPYLKTKVLLQDEQQQSFQGCFKYGEDVTCDSSLILERPKTMDKLAEHSFGDEKTLLKDKTRSHVVAVHLGTETSLQQKETQSIRSFHRVVNGDKILLLGNFETMDFLPNHDKDCGNKKSLPSDGSDRLATSCHLETEMPLLQKQTPNVQSCSQVVHDDRVLVPEISEVMFPKFDAGCGNKDTSLGSDYMEEACHLVRKCHDIVPSDAAPVLESCGPLSDFPSLHGDSAKKNSLLDEAPERVSTEHQKTVVLPMDEHYHSCCGDTSSVLEYSTMDTSTGDGGSEHKNSFDQKDDETLYSVTGSKDHSNTANTFSSDESRSCAPIDDQVCSKVVLLKEEQHQNFCSRPELAHENSSSVDSFAVSAEGCGSKSGIAADRTSVHQVADLLGTNSESRTSFMNDSSGETAETSSTSALGSENADDSVSGSELYVDPPILQHDPGEEMKLL